MSGRRSADAEGVVSTRADSQAPGTSRPRLGTAAGAALGAALFLLLCWLAASTDGAAYQRMRRLEIEQENAAACVRLGFSAASEAEAACRRELMNVRELHARRLAADSML